jgi:catechol 2,3-dioxygenase-like lactoylglutathione lyase family enzyme
MTELYDVGGVLLQRPFVAGRLGHMGLYVRDLDASRTFYRDLLGFRYTDDLRLPDISPDPIGSFLTYNTDHHAMVLVDSSLAKARNDRYETRGITLNQMSFQVSTLQEIVDAHTMLQEQGRPIWRIGRDVPGSNWAVYFIDPDGHTVELFYGMEQIGWDQRSKPVAEFKRLLSLGVPELPQPAELDEIAAVEAAGGDLASGNRWTETRPPTYNVGGVMLPRPFRVVNTGPMSLFVDDMAASVEFYRDVMGLAVTEQVEIDGQPITYMRTGAEHHSLALVAKPLRSDLGFDERTTVAAYGVQVVNYRQLRDAAAFLADEGCTIVDVPAELHLGIDFAVHVLDPDGHCVRLYHEMENVGSRGEPQRHSERRVVAAEWPQRLTPNAPTSPNSTFQGPLG